MFDDEIEGNCIQNRVIRRSIYDDYIVAEMRRTELEYTSYLGLDIWIGTWNINGKRVEQVIPSWLFASGSGKTDIFVIGLEEMVDLTASTVVSESQSIKRSQQILEAIQAVLNRSSNSYYCVASKVLVGVFLCVFAQSSLRSSISRVMSFFSVSCHHQLRVLQQVY